VNPEGRYARYVLAVLTVVYTVNHADRQILSIVLPLIKHDLGFTDTQLGALSGTAFALVYVAVGLPIARRADGGHRVTIITLALAFWSAMTAVSGLVTTYLQLLLARMGVAVGEAGCTPPAHSVLSDYYPPVRRPAAIAIYSLGVPLGTVVGFMVGGWVAQYYGWRSAFLVLGLPGLAVALLLRLTVREPVRGLADGVDASATNRPPFWDVIRSLTRSRQFRHLALATGLLGFQGYAGGAWIPTLLFRKHGMSLGEIGTAFAILSLIAGITGSVLGGWLGAKLAGGDRRWLAWIPAAAMLVATPFWLVGLYAGNKYLALFGFFVPTIAENVYFGPVNSLLQELAGVRARAVASASFLLCTNLIGLGGGPLITGWLSDLLGGSLVDNALRTALLVAPASCLWSAFHYWRAGASITPHRLTQLGAVG